MLKKIIALTTAGLLFTACAPPADSGKTLAGSVHDVVLTSDAAPPAKAPRIQRPPSIPGPAATARQDSARIDGVLQQVNGDLNRPAISAEEIIRGYYYGSQDAKKFGTPNSWQWINDGKDSRWANASVTEEKDRLDAKKICEATAGTYAFSCAETDVAGCEFIPASLCRCGEGASFQPEQGCIRTDADGNFIVITQADLKTGWYTGQKNQKKLNTPSQWIWQEAGTNSRWQNSRPLN